jgi:hypothetical protein
MPPAEHGSAARAAFRKIALIVVAAACSRNSGARSPCAAEVSVAARNTCYEQQALQLGSRELCSQVPGPHDQAICLMAFAEHGDVTACQEAEAIFPIPECFSRVAAMTEKVEICDYIATFDGRVSCVKNLAQHTRDAKWCARIQAPNDRDECVASLADEARDVSICDGVQNPFRRDRCRLGKDATYFRGAACEHVEATRRRDDCYLAVVNHFYSTRDHFDLSPDLCDKVVGRKVQCLIHLAKSHPELCERVGSGPDSVVRRLCYDTAFEGPRDSCVGISDQAPRLACESRVAARAKDSAVCTTITNSEDADDCWDAVAKTDGAWCLRIKQPDLQHRCLRKNWAKAKDGAICSSVTPTALSQACATRFGLDVASKTLR